MDAGQFNVPPHHAPSLPVKSYEQEEAVLCIEESLCRKLYDVNLNYSKDPVKWVFNPMFAQVKNSTDEGCFLDEEHTTDILYGDYSSVNNRGVVHLTGDHTNQLRSPEHKKYLNKFLSHGGAEQSRVLFLGMNPGAKADQQFGIPFYDDPYSKSWLSENGSTALIDGTDGTSGSNLCYALRESGLFGDDGHSFFKDNFLYNYCPIAFKTGSGGNIPFNPKFFKCGGSTELTSETQSIIEGLCDEALLEITRVLNISRIVGIGRYTENRAKFAYIQPEGVTTPRMFEPPTYLPHPSPRNFGSPQEYLPTMMENASALRPTNARRRLEF